MAKTINSGKGQFDRKTLTLVAAILVIVLVVGVFAIYAHGRSHPSPTQAAAESKAALEKAAQLVNSGQAAGAKASGGEQKPATQ
jgi:uncharacterized protein (UPF0333 family)